MDIHHSKGDFSKVNMSSTDDWYKVSSRQEAEDFIEYIINNPSTEWRHLMEKAESGSVPYYDILIERSDSIYASIAEAIANEDGLVITPKSDA